MQSRYSKSNYQVAAHIGKKKSHLKSHKKSSTRHYVIPIGKIQHHLKSILAPKLNLNLIKPIDPTTIL